MARFGLSRGYSRQPTQNVPPNWRHSLCNRLVSLANFGVAHPLGRAWDAVTNTPWTQNGTTGTGVTSRGGRALAISGNGSISNAGLVLSSKITGPWTVLIVAAQSASGTAVLCSSATQAAPYCASFSGVWSISNTANGSVSANGTMQVVAFRQLATSADVTVNGIKGTANAQNYAAWAAGVAYMADFGSGGGFPMVGQLAMAAIWNRALTDSEIQSLTANPWQLFYSPSELLESLGLVSNTYAVSVAEAATALDAPDRAGGGNYSVSQSDSGTGAEAPSAVSQLAASIAEAMSGVDSQSVPSAVPVVTLKQDWLKNYVTTTQAALRSGQGYANPMTIAAGSAIVALWAGWDATRQIPIPTINTGGPLASFTDAGSTASVLHPNQMTQAMAGVANVAGGSYTVTPPDILDPDSTGIQGEVEVWMLEITNLGTSFTVVDVNAAHRNNTSSSWSISTDGTPQVGDLVLIIGTMENNNAVVSSGVAGPGTFTQIYLNDDGTNFIPTQLAYKVLTAGGTVTVTWTATDPGKTEDFGMVVVLRPAQAASPITAGVTESGTAAESQSVTGALSSTISEAGSAADAPSSTKATASSATETGTASETTTGIQSTGATIAETGTAIEATTGTYSTAASISENATGADSGSTSMTAVASISESATGADSGSSTAALTASASEAATAADSGSATYVATTLRIETGTAAESQDTSGSVLASQSDSGTASDAPSAIETAVATIAESGVASEAAGATKATSGTVSEVGNASELTAADGSIVQVAISESGTAAESESANMITSLGIVESLAASELQSCIGTFYGSVVEALSAADSANGGSAQLAQMIESGAMSEAQDAIKAISVDVLEAMALTDDPGAAFAAVCQAIETGNAQDIENATAVMTAALIEAVAAFDFVNGAKAQFVTIGELLTAVDASSAALFVSSLIRMYRFAEETRLYSFEDDSRRYRFPSENVRTYQFSGEARNYRFKDGG